MPYVFKAIIAFGIISLSIWAISYATKFISENRIEREYEANKKSTKVMEDSVAIAINWPTKSIMGIEFNSISLKTKWENGYMFYIVNIIGAVESINSAQTQYSKSYYSNHYIRFVFSDLDRFKIYSFDIQLKNLTKIIGNNNETLGWKYEDKIYIPLEDYYKFKNWELNWAL